MKAALTAIAISMSLCAHAAEVDLAYGEGGSRWMLDTSNVVRQDGYVAALVIGYTSTGRMLIPTIVNGCTQGYGLMYMQAPSGAETQWYWTRAGDRLFDTIAMGVCAARTHKGVSQ